MQVHGHFLAAHRVIPVMRAPTPLQAAQCVVPAFLVLILLQARHRAQVAMQVHFPACWELLQSPLV